MSNLVTIPKDPYAPINNCFRSIPVLSFLNFDLRFNISPLAKTAYSPKILPLKGPYFIKYFPPAWVETFPPIKHDPFAPKSRGT